MSSEFFFRPYDIFALFGVVRKILSKCFDRESVIPLDFGIITGIWYARANIYALIQIFSYLRQHIHHDYVQGVYI